MPNTPTYQHRWRSVPLRIGDQGYNLLHVTVLFPTLLSHTFDGFYDWPRYPGMEGTPVPDSTTTCFGQEGDGRGRLKRQSGQDLQNFYSKIWFLRDFWRLFRWFDDSLRRKLLNYFVFCTKDMFLFTSTTLSNFYPLLPSFVLIICIKRPLQLGAPFTVYHVQIHVFVFYSFRARLPLVAF